MKQDNNFNVLNKTKNWLKIFGNIKNVIVGIILMIFLSPGIFGTKNHIVTFFGIFFFAFTVIAVVYSIVRMIGNINAIKNNNVSVNDKIIKLKMTIENIASYLFYVFWFGGLIILDIFAIIDWSVGGYQLFFFSILFWSIGIYSLIRELKK